VRGARGVRLEGCEPSLELTGAGADSLASEAGTQAWAQGYCVGGSRMEWLGGHPLGGARIDLFVMSLCPFARRLEASMVEDLARIGAARAPQIAVHYLLHWEDVGGERRAGSTHGDKERIEDAVQILIRDEHPTAYWHYLAMRSKAEVPWEMLAQRAGLGWPAIGSIHHRLAQDLDSLLEAELSFNTRNFPHVSGSPTVYWLGSVARSIGEVPGFTAPPKEQEKCASEGSDSGTSAN